MIIIYSGRKYYEGKLSKVRRTKSAYWKWVGYYFEKMTFELIFEGEGVSSIGISEKRVPVKRKIQCKGHEVGICLAFLKGQMQLKFIIYFSRLDYYSSQGVRGRAARDDVKKREVQSKSF